MSRSIAICQVADTGPLESLVVMLSSLGYECKIPGEKLKTKLKNLGCDNVLDIQHLVENWGYEQPIYCREASVADMANASLFLDIKAHRNGPRIWGKWPALRNRVVWYRINGGEPEDTIHGTEIDTLCPILTPNRWYKEPDMPWSDKAYSFWPPFLRIDNYHREESLEFTEPVCLTHNIEGWGYKSLIQPITELGVKFYGRSSPAGLINHSQVPNLLSTSKALVHLKSNDAPGYSLYEALSSKCPLIVPRRLIWRCKMQDLFIPDETCLVFDRETHDGLTPQDISECTAEIKGHLETLSDRAENKRIGENGFNRLKEVMWDTANTDDTNSLREFLQRTTK